MSEISKPVMSLLHLYSDNHGETHIGTTDVALPLQDYAPPATPFNASAGQPATMYVIVRLPVGWVGEQHTSPMRQVLFCLTGSIRITCSTGEVAVIYAGMGIVMSDISGKGHKSEVLSDEPVNAVIVQLGE